MNKPSEKEEIRKTVWELLDQSGVSRFPTPVVGRIPNYEGAERAAERVTSLQEFRSASVVKVNPDAPQTVVRRAVLSTGKRLVMPSPRLRKGFLVLDADSIRRADLRRASTIRGAHKYGSPCVIEDLPRIDLVVAGSVAVSRSGARVGKGGGYSEIEYGILRDLELLHEETPILTTVHELQIVDRIPREDHDFLVDAIITPARVIRVTRGSLQPTGIIWEKLSPRMLESMPILRELQNYLKNRV